MKPREKPSKRRPDRIKRLYIALFLMFLALVSGWLVPFSGVLDLVFGPGEPCTLADQIRASNTRKPAGGCPAGTGTDTIQLHDDLTLDHPLPIIRTTIIIEGNGFTIDAGGENRIFEVHGSTLQIHDLNLTRSTSPRGRVILLRAHADLLLSRSAISGASAINGAAITSVQSNLDIVESTFSNNEATRNGGAINVSLSSKLRLRDSTFIGNSGRYGGGFYSKGSDVVVENSTFQDNKAEAGGGFYGEDSDIKVSGSTLETNRAELYGGAIYSDSGLLIISDSRIAGNKLVRLGYGGAIGSDNALISISDSVIADNSGARYGGAIQSGGGSLNVYRSNLRDNSATFGGAIHYDKAAINIEDSTLAGNFSYQRGGGIYSTGGSIRIFSASIRNNLITAVDYIGGGIDNGSLRDMRRAKAEVRI